MNTRQFAPVTDVSWHVGTCSHAGTPAQHAAAGAATGATKRAVGSQAVEREGHGSESVALFARLAELHAEMAGIYRETAEIQLAARAGSALMCHQPKGTDEMATNAPGRGEKKRLPPALEVAGIVRWCTADIDNWIARNVEAAS